LWELDVIILARAGGKSREKVRNGELDSIALARAGGTSMEKVENGDGEC
jgi:ABC-type xylose transport system permease subunit